MTPWGGVPCPFGGMGFGGFSSQCGMRVPADDVERSEVRGKLSHSRSSGSLGVNRPRCD